ncbi:hypothetical protein M426DRAFT_322790 [Hypoxylon sp. CI-4A]|nr:hypothetical protein M426DRAFT_322790 [Hypoxylon sp. CI-4A]
MASNVFPPPSLKALAEEIVSILTAKGETVSVAETAAGGLISASILSVPGASKVYKGGLTLYSLESRLIFGAWTQTDVDNFNGHNVENVGKLAENVREKLNSTWAIGESGTAGPTGGNTRSKTPGFAVVAVNSAKGTSGTELETGHNRRDDNMIEFTTAALKLLKGAIGESG